ncbi:hypothetical protein [uncultured Paraglaciecola sp.]|nr:hypothetical protein [uncultured Paraglaciecola sp.]
MKLILLVLGVITIAGYSLDTIAGYVAVGYCFCLFLIAAFFIGANQ